MKCKVCDNHCREEDVECAVCKYPVHGRRRSDEWAGARKVGEGLHCIEGEYVTLKQIASKLGCSVPVVRMRMAKLMEVTWEGLCNRKK